MSPRGARTDSARELATLRLVLGLIDAAPVVAEGALDHDEAAAHRAATPPGGGIMARP